MEKIICIEFFFNQSSQKLLKENEWINLHSDWRFLHSEWIKLFVEFVFKKKHENTFETTFEWRKTSI